MTRLKFLRIQNGWSQERLAYLLSVQAPDVSRMERNHYRNIPDRWREELKRLFNLSFEELMQEKE